MSSNPNRSGWSREGGTALLFALLLALIGGGGVMQLTQKSVGHDFYQFWAVGRYLAASEDPDLYSATTAGAIARSAARRVAGSGSERGVRAAALNRGLYAHGVEPISTPWYYVAFAALGSDDYDRDLDAFQTISSVLFLLAAWLCCRAVGFTPLAAALALATLMLAYGPLHADVQTGNVNRLQLAFVAASVAIGYRWPGFAGRAGGACLLAAAIAFKPNLAAIPLFLAAVWIVDRRSADLRWGAAGLALGGVGAAGFAALVFGSAACWSEWITALGNYQSTPAAIEQTNWSTARLIYEWTGRDVSLPLATLLLASLVACSWRGRRGRDARGVDLHRDLVTVSAAALVPLIASQLAWDHYFLLATPAIVVLLRPAPDALPRQLLAAAALWVCARGPLELVAPVDSAHDLAAYLAVATAALWIGLLFEIARSEPCAE